MKPSLQGVIATEINAATLTSELTETQNLPAVRAMEIISGRAVDKEGKKMQGRTQIH